MNTIRDQDGVRLCGEWHHSHHQGVGCDQVTSVNDGPQELNILSIIQWWEKVINIVGEVKNQGFSI